MDGFNVERLPYFEDDDSSLHLSAVSEVDREENDLFKYCSGRSAHRRTAPQDQLFQNSLVSPSTVPSHQEMNVNIRNTSIVSPPFSMQSNDSYGIQLDQSVVHVSDLLSTVKQEIRDIYLSLSENNDVEDTTISSKADEASLVHMMKTNEVLMSTLRKTYLHAKYLQEENAQLQNQLQSRPSIPEKKMDTVQLALNNLDTTDNYVRRIYPDIMKSPGTVSVCVY
jgi:hypothetical protein